MDRKQALEVLARNFSAGIIECGVDEYMILTETLDDYGVKYNDDTIDDFANSLCTLVKSIRPSLIEVAEAIKVLSS